MKSTAQVPRRIDGLPGVVEFVDRALAGSSLGDEARHTAHFAIEELLTNMIKYAPHGAPGIAIQIECSQGVVDVTLIDSGVDYFDPTAARDAPIAGSVATRRPGGLGLHLVGRLVAALRYDYVAERREGTTRFRVGRPIDAAGHAVD